MKRKILFLTGSRAEYGLLKNLIKQFKEDQEFKTYIAVTGSHLSKKFGNTNEEISKDGFYIDKELKIPLNDSSNGISKAISKFISLFSEYLEAIKPDLLIVLGDRYEVFAGVVVAHVHNIKIAHIHGGELTEGAFDDAFRHSITKMSTIHFTACDEYRNRVIQLGEQPTDVYNVGLLGLDAISKISFLAKPKLEKDLNIKFHDQNFLVTFHPETKLSLKENLICLNELLCALSNFSETLIIFTGVNADTFHSSFKKQIDKFCRKNNNSTCFESLGQVRYFSCLKQVDMVIGNSSSGILEVPWFKIPTINIGNRQKGRLQGDSIINCKPESKAISAAIKRGLVNKSNPKKFINSPYKAVNSANKIYKIIKKNKNTSSAKTFFDINL